MINNNGSEQIPPDSTPITTEQLFSIIGELFVQTRVLQTMLRRQLDVDKDGAVKERSLQG